MSELGSVLFYSLVGALSFFFAFLCEKKKSKIFPAILVVLFTLVAGLRNRSVGIDTDGYVELLLNLKNGYVDHLSNIDEVGFISLSYLLLQICGDYTLLLVVYALITNSLIITRLYELRDKISFPLAIFIYFNIYYFFIFNTLRQWIAIAIVFYFSKHITPSLKKCIIYGCGVLIASLFHYSAIVCFALIPIYYLFYDTNKIKFVVLKIISIAGIFALGFILIGIMNDNYSTYFDMKTSEISFLTIIRIAGFILFWILCCYPQFKKIRNDDVVSFKFYSLLYFMGLCATMLVFFFRYADRVAEYFMIFEVIFFPYCFKKSKRYKYIVLAFVAAFCLYLRFSSFASSGYGEIPYIPFWG